TYDHRALYAFPTRRSSDLKADDIDLEYPLTEKYKKKGSGLRGSIMLVGPLLARFGKGYIPKPGGDKIGRRRLDTHFVGFEKLGRSEEHTSELQSRENLVCR